MLEVEGGDQTVGGDLQGVGREIAAGFGFILSAQVKCVACHDDPMTHTMRWEEAGRVVNNRRCDA
jgi:hypothetical protein